MIALVVVGAIAFVMLRVRGDAKRETAPPRANAKGVDVERYRASYRQRLEAAHQVVARRRAAQVAASAGQDAGTAEAQARAAEARTFLMREMMEPQCILGPAELCATIDEPVSDCAAGDGRACLAVGQYLADTPPRPLIAISYFLYACKAGDEEGCKRMKEVKEPTDAPCTDDVFRCGWLAYRSHDPARLDEACTEGVADACSWLITSYDRAGDLDRSRTYLEAACQLGSPMACNELGRRLMPGCKPEADEPCYAPDPAEAAEARTIACEAGFAEACD